MAAADQAQRADPALIGAADAVAVVVGVVDPDLQREGDDQREQRPTGTPDLDREGGAGSHEHRGDRGGQGAGAGSFEPVRGSGHGSTKRRPALSILPLGSRGTSLTSRSSRGAQGRGRPAATWSRAWASVSGARRTTQATTR